MKLARAMGPWLLSGLVMSLVMGACRKESAPSPKPDAAAKEDDKAASSGAAGKQSAPDLRATPFPLTLWAAFLAQRDYVDPSRFSGPKQLDQAMAGMESSAPKFFARREGTKIEARVGEYRRSFDLPKALDMQACAQLLVQVLEFAVEHLELSVKKRHELEYAAFNGLLRPLDPHTMLLTPEQNASLGVRTRGHFGGIGAEIWAEDRRIRIVRVLPNTPAERAGMMDGDLVYKIDDRSSVNMTASEAQRLLRGPIDSVVKVQVKRNKAFKTLSITRGKIEIPAVRDMVLPNEVGYVELLGFQEQGAKQVLDAMSAQVKGGAKALLLDLRRNSGGLLTEALALVDGLVDKGELISVLSREGKEVQTSKEPAQVPMSMPIVVLISQSSASASEIVSGSLSALGRGVVVGRRSFGKGSVQQLFPAEPYGEELALKLTVAEYRVANDTKIQGIGVVPTLALYPMHLGEHRGVGSFFDNEAFEEHREGGVYGKEDRAKAPESLFSLRYLAKTPWDKPAGDLKDKAKRAFRDPEIKIASALALALAAEPKAQEKQVIEGFVKKERVTQEKALVKALSRWKINWKAPEPGAAAPLPDQLALSVELIKVQTRGSGRRRKLRVKKVSGPQDLAIGDIFTLRVTAKNLGSTPLSRVHLRTEYFLPELDAIETVLGTIAPKGKRSIDLRLQIAPGRAGHVGDLAVEAFVGPEAQAPLRSETIRLGFDAMSKPKLAFSYWIVDSPARAKSAPKRPDHEAIAGETPFVVQGDGNGLAAPGEKVLIAFEVRNEGQVAAELPSIVVRNRSREQALLEEGAAPLDALAPGKRAYASVAMTISEKADPEKPIDLQLMVGDRKSSTVVERELALDVQDPAQKARWQAQAPELKESQETLALRADPGALAPRLGEIKGGESVDVLGTMGEFVALAGPMARVLWTQGSLSPTQKPRRKRQRLQLTPMVVPPVIDLSLPTLVSSPSLTIEGKASDDRELEDIVVWTVPQDRGKLAKKLLYREVAATAKGPDRRELSMSTKLKLEPGPSRIRVVVRDNDHVATSQDYWVYATDPSQPTKAAGASKPGAGPRAPRSGTPAAGRR